MMHHTHDHTVLKWLKSKLHSPYELVVVEEGGVADLGEGRLEQVDEALDAQVGVLV